jgi:hypothetical protein
LSSILALVFTSSCLLVTRPAPLLSSFIAKGS